MLGYRALFLLSVFGLLLIKRADILAFLLIFLWFVSYKDFKETNIKIIKYVLPFNAGVSVGYIVMSLFKDVAVVDYLLYINLKVYVLSYFVLYFFSKIDMVRFFSFSKNLGFLLNIAMSQIISYTKSFEEFRCAYKARVVKRLKEREKEFIKRVLHFFFDKAMKDARERALAMRARGFFDRT